jgi:AraC-like DNA-binding protein
MQIYAKQGANPFLRFVGKPYGTYHYALRDTLRKRYDSKNKRFVMSAIAQMKSLPDALHDKQWQLEADFMKACYMHDYVDGDSLAFVKEMKRLQRISLNAGNQVFYVRIVRRLFDFYKSYDLTDGISAARNLEKVLNTVTPEQYPDIVDCQFRLGEYYYFFKDYKRAEKYFLNTVNHRYEPAIYAIFIHARNNLGAICRTYYHDLNASDRWILSMASFRRRHHITEMADTYESWMIGDLGRNQMLRGNYVKAIGMLKRSLSGMMKSKEYSYSYNAAVYIALSYCRIGLFNEALPYLKVADYCWKKNDAEILYDRQDYFMAMSQYYFGTGKVIRGICYQDSSVEYRDQRDAHYNMNAFLQIEQQMSKMEYQQEKKRSEDNHNRFMLMLFVSIVVTIALISCIILYEQKRRAYSVLVKKNQQWASVPQKKPEEHDEEDLKSHGNDRAEESPYDGVLSINGEQNAKLIVIIKNYVQQSRCFLNPDVSLSDVARAVYSNRSYVSKAINADYANFNTFINEYRIQEAVRMISKNGDVALNDIMVDVGFRSRKTFYNAFKQFTGLSPVTFKNNLNN